MKPLGDSCDSLKFDVIILQPYANTNYTLKHLLVVLIYVFSHSIQYPLPTQVLILCLLLAYELDFKMGQSFEVQHAQCHRLDGSAFQL